MRRDVIIVGGGVIGCSIAWRLAQAGLKVTVFERGRVGCEASRAAAGMLSPQGESQTAGPFFDLCLRSRAMYRSFAEELTDASGIDVEYKDEGTLFVVLEGEHDEDRTRWAAWQLEAGLPLDHVSAEDIRRLEPAVTESAARAVFLPEEHQVENRRVMDALEVAIKRAGVDVVEGVEVTAIRAQDGRATGVSAAKHTIEAGAVIVAAGTWSGQLLDPLGLKVELIPARGQMLAVRPARNQIVRVLHSSKVYIGATVEYAGFEKAVTVEGLNYLLMQGRMRRSGRAIGHVRNYSAAELRRKLEQAGLEVLKIGGWGFPFYSPIYRSLAEWLPSGPPSGPISPLGKGAARALYRLYRLNWPGKGDVISALAQRA